MYLSSTNETTQGTTLSSCITSTYAAEAPGWRFAPVGPYNASRIGVWFSNLGLFQVQLLLR